MTKTQTGLDTVDSWESFYFEKAGLQMEAEM